MVRKEGPWLGRRSHGREGGSMVRKAGPQSGRRSHGREGGAAVISAEKQEPLNVQETRHTGEGTTHPSQWGGGEADLHGLHSVSQQPDSYWPETWTTDRPGAQNPVSILLAHAGPARHLPLGSGLAATCLCGQTQPRPRGRARLAGHKHRQGRWPPPAGPLPQVQRAPWSCSLSLAFRAPHAGLSAHSQCTEGRLLSLLLGPTEKPQLAYPQEERGAGGEGWGEKGISR